MAIGLALGGGGSRGAFQIGAWQAFRELGLQFDAITGTSIGSINGALMACDIYDRALFLWQHLQMDQCLLFSGDQSVRSDDLLSLKNANILTREILTHRSLNTQPLRDMLNGYIDEAKLRQSKTRYGLMTALVPDLRPQPYWIEDIPPGLLVEYIMASARLPGLTPVAINGHRMIDGGFAEMVPLSLLRECGIRQIVAISLDTRAMIRSPILDNVQLTYIHDRQSLGHALDITPEILEHNRRLGYLDTMKAFGKLAGEYYSFEPDEFKWLLARFGSRHLAGLEQAALAYELDRLPVYAGQEFIDAILLRRREIQAAYAQKREALRIDHKLRAIAKGSLKVLSLLPPMQLSFLLELTAIHRAAGTLSRIPARFFKNLDLAVQALNVLDEQTSISPEQHPGSS
jgi:NTE family protein